MQDYEYTIFDYIMALMNKQLLFIWYQKHLLKLVELTTNNYPRTINITNNRVLKFLNQ